MKNCNGCSACIVGCKYSAIKMVEGVDGRKFPVIDENGCTKCNNCLLYCPLYNPVELPEFEDFYEYHEDYYKRDMPKVYRVTKRSVKNGVTTDFTGTLCQIAGLKSLMGDKLSHDLRLFPLFCDKDDPKRPECEGCVFWNEK